MFIVLTFILNAGLNFILGLAIAAVLGPAEYGRFAVGLMVAVVLGTAGFDWLRLSATRFYTEGGRGRDRSLRATLDAGYWGMSGLLLAVTVLLVVSPVGLGLSAAMLVAAVAAALGNARFDFAAALARARFLDGTYGRLVIVKNVAAFALMVGAAALFKSAPAVLAALAVSAILAIVPARAGLRDAEAPLSAVRRDRLAAFARYGLPIVAANVIYQLIVLANRSVAAAHLGFADAGQLSLATDMSIRLLLAIGAALDVSLFQLVVRSDASEGRAAAHRQVVRNMLAVTAVLALLATGYAVAMPAFEALVVPAKFRGDFGPLSLVLVPGILVFCLVNFGLNPVFQLAGRTGPVVWAALAALAVDLAGLAGLSVAGYGVSAYAVVHSASLLAGGMVAAALAFRTRDCRPPWRDLGVIALAAGAAALAIWPTRSIGQPALALPAALVAGTGAYGAVLCGFDLLGLRDFVRQAASRLGALPGLRQRGVLGDIRHG